MEWCSGGHFSRRFRRQIGSVPEIRALCFYPEEFRPGSVLRRSLTISAFHISPRRSACVCQSFAHAGGGNLYMMWSYGPCDPFEYGIVPSDYRAFYMRFWTSPCGNRLGADRGWTIKARGGCFGLGRFRRPDRAGAPMLGEGDVAWCLLWPYSCGTQI